MYFNFSNCKLYSDTIFIFTFETMKTKDDLENIRKLIVNSSSSNEKRQFLYNYFSSDNFKWNEDNIENEYWSDSFEEVVCKFDYEYIPPWPASQDYPGDPAELNITTELPTRTDLINELKNILKEYDLMSVSFDEDFYNKEWTEEDYQRLAEDTFTEYKHTVELEGNKVY